MNKFHLAQVNIAKKLAPLEDPIMKDFVNNIDKINAVAEASKGFVWRLKDEDKAITSNVFKDDSLLINMSVWNDVESLFEYTYNSLHVAVFKRRKEWFSKLKMKHMAFWYIPIGHEPTLTEAKIRLDYLKTHGETPYAFTFKKTYTVTDLLNYKPAVV
ncbi:DUF3291 domain-containing protein [Snuella sedimenti]|uniref:DUF3291 domain-containing protein n=1 Tax=Snuella sedimenti TaxID=2798802 RepID=A0A8J7IGZ4_9FLAO|nr:DUF3291 domain-containing protein [Snuella sedimenti]MBJ6369827.1 DUF3291 domain-containing protein [Snuella sedimenti]